MKKNLLLLLLICFASVKVYAQKHDMFIGTYTKKPSNSLGVYSYTFNSKNGSVKRKANFVRLENPSYLALSHDKKTIYAVSENGTNSGISSIQYNAATGTRKTTSFKQTSGADPCFVLADDLNVIVANYTGGSIDVYAIGKNKAIADLKQSIQHTGRGPDERQASAHVHQVQFSPDKKYVIATDLGEDAIYVYNYLPKAKQPLTIKETIKVKAGYGPRHLAFSPNGAFVYLTNEYSGTINVYSYNDGKLTLIQEIQTVQEGFKGAIDAADIHTSSDGKFLYQTNRGDLNNINTYAINRDGTLTFVQSTSTLGKGPRNFTIDPTGKFLLVAHQYTNNIVIFERDVNNGKLSRTGKEIKVDAPVCVIF